MEVDAGLWALLACIIGFVTLGCFMTAPNPGWQSLARKQPSNRH